MPTSDVTLPYQAYKALREIAPHFKPKIGIVLGSGLSDFAQILTDKQVIDYQDLPGFPNINVYGHRGQLLLGYIAGVEVICLQGRAHYYEGPTAAQGVSSRATACRKAVRADQAGRYRSTGQLGRGETGSRGIL